MSDNFPIWLSSCARVPGPFSPIITTWSELLPSVARSDFDNWPADAPGLPRSCNSRAALYELVPGSSPRVILAGAMKKARRLMTLRTLRLNSERRGAALCRNPA